MCNLLMRFLSRQSIPVFCRIMLFKEIVDSLHLLLQLLNSCFSNIIPYFTVH
jgi:hypothetical protein